MVSSPTSPIRGTHIVIDRARVIAVAIRAAPTRVIPRINIRATEMQRILCPHVMVAAEGSGIRAFRPVTVIRNRGTLAQNQIKKFEVDAIDRQQVDLHARVMKQDVLPIVLEILRRRYGDLTLISGQGILKGERVEFVLEGKRVRCVIKTSTGGPSLSVREALKITVALQRADIPAP
jgi:hypothetical protein